MWTYTTIGQINTLQKFLNPARHLIALSGSQEFFYWFSHLHLSCIPCFRKDHERCEFDVHEVYGIDVLVSTGEGKVCSL